MRSLTRREAPTFGFKWLVSASGEVRVCRVDVDVDTITPPMNHTLTLIRSFDLGVISPGARRLQFVQEVMGEYSPPALPPPSPVLAAGIRSRGWRPPATTLFARSAHPPNAGGSGP